MLCPDQTPNVDNKLNWTDQWLRARDLNLLTRRPIRFGRFDWVYAGIPRCVILDRGVSGHYADTKRPHVCGVL